MHILLVHNFYQQPGGEDRVFQEEAELLERYGHRVSRFTAHNDDVASMGRLALATSTVWNMRSYRALIERIEKARPDVVHFHNTLPLVSPSGYFAARRLGVAVVQTLHNYRLLCPGVYFYRNGTVCEDCLGRRVPWPSVLHGCYRESRGASAAVTAMVTAHRAVGTWSNKVDAYVTITDFVRRKFVQGGLPEDHLKTKPHFVHPPPAPGSGDGGYALFVGRLTKEKGVGCLLSAWNRMENGAQLSIVGDGPLAPAVAEVADAQPSVRWLGQRSRDEVLDLMAGAWAVIVPSEWYETFGRVIIEAFAVGTPVVASNLGAMAELVTHGRTGRHFQPGDAEDLATQLTWMLRHPDQVRTMRGRARDEYEAKYTAERNYRMLMAIYDDAIAAAGTRVARIDESGAGTKESGLPGAGPAGAEEVHL